MTGLRTPEVLNALISHALALGVFDSVNQFEPSAEPGAGAHLTLAYDQWRPHRSGLDSTSVVSVFSARVGVPLTLPLETVEERVLAAHDAYVDALSGDFTLTSPDDGSQLITGVDLLGESGFTLSGKAGYVPYSDGPTYRVIVVTVPLIISDVWGQEP
jgi:hypothetical protein